VGKKRKLIRVFHDKDTKEKAKNELCPSKFCEKAHRQFKK
jgi:hypothetical protein